MIGGKDERAGKPRRVFPSPSVVFVLSLLLSPSSFQIIIHSLPSTPRTWTSQCHSHLLHFLPFSPPPLGSTFFACSPINWASLPPQFPYPSLATILKHRSCPLLASLTVSGLQRKSDKRYNRVCLFLQQPSLDLLSGRSFDPTSCALVTFGQLYTTEQFFCFFILPCSKQNSILCLPEYLAS